MNSGIDRCGVTACSVIEEGGDDGAGDARYSYQSFVASRSMSGAQFLDLVVRDGLGREEWGDKAVLDLRHDIHGEASHGGQLCLQTASAQQNHVYLSLSCYTHELPAYCVSYSVPLVIQHNAMVPQERSSDLCSSIVR